MWEKDYAKDKHLDTDKIRDNFDHRFIITVIIHTGSIDLHISCRVTGPFFSISYLKTPGSEPTRQGAISPGECLLKIKIPEGP